MIVHFRETLDLIDLLIVPLDIDQSFPPLLQEIDSALNGEIHHMIRRENFKRKRGEILELTTNGSHSIPRVILVGGGDSPLTSLDMQEMGGEIASLLKGKKIGIESHQDRIADLAFGLKLKVWHFHPYHTQRKREEKEVIFLTSDQKPWRWREHLYQGVAIARNLTAEPANQLTPSSLAHFCMQLVHEGIEVEVFDEEMLKEMGAEGILTVGKGSLHPPRLVVMQWKGDCSQKPIALIGKGVCFDSGGINIKTEELVEMKFDKAGAAAVIGTLVALAKEKTPLHVVGVIGIAENMIDGAAMKPGDIITTLAGKTVEIVNTDYEGRLILADCLWYVQERFQPSTLIDLGTLTPETVAALGDAYAGLYCEEQELRSSLIEAGQQSGEKVWPLPMGSYFAKQIQSEYADIKNMGIPNFGEGGAAAEFLRCFIQSGVQWAHLDIAGVAWSIDHNPLNRKGVTGFGVRLLMEWLYKYIAIS